MKYLELVNLVKNEYRNNQKRKDSDKASLAWCDDGSEDLCKEINLWTYWQGLGYAINMPEIDYLIVGQDWGNPNAPHNRPLLDRIREMNNKKIQLPYYCKTDPKIYETDKNLAELCKVIGFGNDEESILEKRYSNLFFTNFSLGYRKEGTAESGGMTAEIMDRDAKYFYELVKILKPKRIICLGKITFAAVYKSLKNGEKKPSNLNKSYNKFLESQHGFDIDIEGLHTKVFPVAHCGALGTMNRNKGADAKDELIKEKVKEDKLYLQKKDWEKAIISL